VYLLTVEKVAGRFSEIFLWILIQTIVYDFVISIVVIYSTVPLAKEIAKNIITRNSH